MLMAKRTDKPAPDSPDNPWPALLRAAKVKSGLSNARIAASLGITLNTYEHWLYGRRVPSRPSQSLIRQYLAKNS